MRTLFWDALPPARVAGTFWESHPPNYSLLDAPAVQELFQAAIRRPGSAGHDRIGELLPTQLAGWPAGTPLAAKKQAAAVAVLDTRRATNIGEWRQRSRAAAAWGERSVQTLCMTVRKCQLASTS